MANLTVGVLAYGALYKPVSLHPYDRDIALFEEVYPNKGKQSHFGDLVTGKMRRELEKGLGWIRKERTSAPDLILIDYHRPDGTEYFNLGSLSEQCPNDVWLEELDMTRLATDGSLLNGFFTVCYELYPKEDVEAALQEALSILTTPTPPDWVETGDDVVTVGANDYMSHQERQAYLDKRELQHADKSKEKEAEVRKLYFNVTDRAATFNLTDDTVIESEEVAPGVILDYGTKGEVVGVELLNINNIEFRMSS